MSESGVRTLLVTKDDGVAKHVEGLIQQATGSFNLARHQAPGDAAAACKSDPPDCILFDQAGGEDGAAFLQLVQSQCGHMPAPVIVLVADEKKPVLAKVIKAGAADYLVLKDLLPDTISRTIRSALERHTLESRLLQQRNLFKAILGGSPGLVAIKNATLEYQAVNPVFCTFLGKAQEEIVGKTDEALFDKKDADAYKKDDANVLKNGIPQTKRIEMSGVEGVRILDVVRTPIIDSAGEVTGVFFAGHDVSLANELEARVHALEATLENVSQDQREMLCRVAPKGVLTFVNRAVCAAFGKNQDQLLGQGFSTLIPKDAQTEVRNLLASLKPNAPAGTHRQKIAVDGHEQWQEWTTRAIYNASGKLEEFISVGRDITALIESEQAAATAQTALDGANTAIAELTSARHAAEDALNSQRAAAEEKDKEVAHLREEHQRRSEAVQALERQVQEKDQALHGLQEKTGQVESRINQLNEKLGHQEQTLREKDEALARAQEELTARENAVREKDAVLGELERRTHEAEQLLKANEATLAEREGQTQQAREQAEHVARELQVVKSKLEELLQLIPTAVFELAAGTKITSMSPAAAVVLGCDPNEAEGGNLTLLDFFDPKDKKGATECMKESMQHRTRTAGEFRIIRRDGTAHEVLLTAAPIVREEKIFGMNVALTDISQSKESSKVLERVRRLADTTAATAGILTGVARLTSGLAQDAELELDPEKLEAFENAASSARTLLEDLLTQHQSS